MKKTLATLLLLAVVALVVTGLLVVASASALKGPTPWFFLKRQVTWLAFAVGLGFFASKFDYHYWKKVLIWKKYPLYTMGFYLLLAFLLALTLCPGLAVEHKGSYRWLYIGGNQIFQPGEFAKLAIIVTLAFWLDHVKWRVQQFKEGIAIPALLLGTYALLLFLEKDLGATMVVCVIGGVLIFVGGARWRHLLALGASGSLVLAGIILLAMNTNFMGAMFENRMERIKAWREGSGDAAWQVEQSIIAFKSGGLQGVGFNQSTQKQFYLPEAHTDFIFAIGGEELGFFFSIGVLVAYAILLMCGVLVSIYAPDRLGRLLAFGMTLLLVFQGAFNIGVVTDFLPTKGMALPFMSYGGSNLLTALFAIGTIYNVLRHMGVRDERMHTHVIRNAADTV